MSDDFSDPANWHPIEEHPYLNDPPKVTYPPTPGGAREAVARILRERYPLHSNGFNDETADDVLTRLRPIIAAEIRQWATEQRYAIPVDEKRIPSAYWILNKLAGDVTNESEIIAARICGKDNDNG